MPSYELVHNPNYTSKEYDSKIYDVISNFGDEVKKIKDHDEGFEDSREKYLIGHLNMLLYDYIYEDTDIYNILLSFREGSYLNQTNFILYPEDLYIFLDKNQKIKDKLIDMGFYKDGLLFEHIESEYYKKLRKIDIETDQLRMKKINSYLNSIKNNNNIIEINNFLNGGNLKNIDIKNIDIFFTKFLIYNELKKRSNKNKLEEEIYNELSSDILFSTFTNEQNPKNLQKSGQIAKGFTYSKITDEKYELKINSNHIENNPEYIQILMLLGDFDFKKVEVIDSEIIYEIGKKGIEYLKYYKSIIEKITFFENIQNFSIIKQNNFFKKINYNFDYDYWEEKGENLVLNFLIKNANLENLQGNTIKEKLKNTIITYETLNPNQVRSYSLGLYDNIKENLIHKKKLENEILEEKQRLENENNPNLELSKKIEISKKSENEKAHKYIPIGRKSGILKHLDNMSWGSKDGKLISLQERYFNLFSPYLIERKRMRVEKRYNRMNNDKLKEELHNHIDDRVSSYLPDIYDLYKANYKNKSFLNYIYNSLYKMLYNETYRKIHFFNVGKKEVGTLFEIEKDNNTIYLGGFNSIKNLKLGFTLFKEVVEQIGKEKNIKLNVLINIGEEKNYSKDFLIKRYQDLGFKETGKKTEKRNNDGSLIYRDTEMIRPKDN